MNNLRRELGDPSLTSADFSRYLTIQDVKDRVDAVNVLKQYGIVLNTLATDNETTNIKNASDSFIASLKQVHGVSLSSNDYSAIGDAVQAVGGIFIEIMRAKAVKTVVAKADTPIRTIISLVEDDFDPAKSEWHMGYSAVALGLTGAAEIAEKRLPYRTATQPAAPTTEPTNNLADTALIARARSTAEQNKAKIDQASAAIRTAGEAIIKAETNLNDALNNGKLDNSDIEDLVKQVQSFVEIYNLLHTK